MNLIGVIENEMKKNIKKALKAFTLIFVILGSFFLISCNKYNNNRIINSINNYYNIDLPMNMKLLYKASNSGFGDGTFYYVYDTTFDVLNDEMKSKFIPLALEEYTNITVTCGTIKNLDKTFYYDFSHDNLYSCYGKGEFDRLYLVYDKTSSLLFVLNYYL